MKSKNTKTINYIKNQGHKTKRQTIPAISTTMVAMRQQLLLLSRSFIIFLFAFPILCVLSSMPTSKSFFIYQNLHRVERLVLWVPCRCPCFQSWCYGRCRWDRQGLNLDLFLVFLWVTSIVWQSWRWCCVFPWTELMKKLQFVVQWDWWFRHWLFFGRSCHKIV